MMDRGGRSVALIRLADIGRLILGSTIAQAVFVFIASSLGHRDFWGAFGSIVLGDLWYVAGYRWFARRRGWAMLRERFASTDPRVLLLCVAGGVALVYGFVGLMSVLAWAGLHVDELPHPFYLPDAAWQLPLAIGAFAIIAPLAEEILFRGLLLDWCRQRMNTWTAIVVVSFLFALAHGIALSSGLAGWLQFGFRAMIGLVASVLTIRFRSLQPSFALHAAVNTIACLSAVLSDSE